MREIFAGELMSSETLPTMKPRSSEPAGNDRFMTTRWTVVLAAGDKTPKADEALAQLCQNYWVPLYAYLRHKGHQPADAAGLCGFGQSGTFQADKRMFDWQ